MMYCSVATKEEIVNSGVTVASLFFRKVFGPQAQKALTVFVALRYVYTLLFRIAFDADGTTVRSETSSLS